MSTEASIEARDKPLQKDSVPAIELSASQWARPEKPEDSKQSSILRNEPKDSTAGTLGKLSIEDSSKGQTVDSRITNAISTNKNPDAPELAIKSVEAITHEANTFLLKASDQTVNQSIFQLPKWARLPQPTPGLGCVSSFSNRYREALQLSGILQSTDDKQYRNLYQVNLDDLNKVMGKDKLIVPIEEKDVKDGDIIEGVNPHTTKRHLGIVGRIENEQRTVYDNFGGKWRHEPLELRFGSYQEKHYYRAFLPKSP